MTWGFLRFISAATFWWHYMRMSEDSRWFDAARFLFWDLFL